MSTYAPIISLVNYSGPIFDQGQEGSCKANQICGALAIMGHEYGVDLPVLSRQQLYNDTRISQDMFNKDSGSILDYAEKVSIETGIGDESSFSYGPDNMFVHPNAKVHAEAANQKVMSYSQINMYQSAGFIAQDVGKALMEGKPVLVDAMIHSGFGTGNQDLSAPTAGGHAYLIVGIDFNKQQYTIQNSWGADWEHNGYGVLKFTDLPGLHANTPFGWDLLNLEVIDGFAGVDQKWTDSRSEAAMVYASVLGRCGETTGIKYWGDSGVSKGFMIDQFLASAEGKAKFGTMDNKHFVAKIYFDGTGRVADQGSIDWFANNLDRGVITRGNLAFDILQTVETGKDTIAAHDRLINMETFSMNYGITYQLDSSHAQQGIDGLAQITSDANSVEIALVGLHQAAYGH